MTFQHQNHFLKIERNVKNIRQKNNKTFEFHVDFVLVIASIYARIKSFASMITKSDWCSHRLAIIQCWSVMRIPLLRIHHRHHTPKTALEICRMEMVRSEATVYRHCNSIKWVWSNRNHLINTNNTFNNQKCSTTTTTTTTIIMVQQMVPVVALLQINSMRHSWKFHTAHNATAIVMRYGCLNMAQKYKLLYFTV